MNVEIKRQLVHGSGILLILVLHFFGKWNSALFFGICLISFLLWSSLRQSKTNMGPLSQIADYVSGELQTYERPNEYFQGVITFLFGSLISVILFPIHIATACIAVLALGDSISTLIGKIWGKHKLPINKKSSWEGSITFFIVAFLVLWLFNPVKALQVALVTTVVEMLPRLDDNLTIPITVGVLLSI